MNQTSPTISWKDAWKSISFRIMFGLSLCGPIAFALVFPTFFDFIEARNGPQMNDFILDFLPSSDVSWVVFFFLYSGIVLGLLVLLRSPRLLVICLQTYILVTLLRMLSITLFPLNPPGGYIALKEPFVQIFTNNGRLISHDLFFSGHVSTICSVLFSLRKPWAKWYVTACVCMVSLLVLVQHVHYTIDVIAALIITYGCYLFAKRFLSPRISQQ